MQAVIIALLSLVAFLAVTVISSVPYDTQFLTTYQPSCSGARKIREDSLSYCFMVDWLAGSLYNTSTFTVYSPGSTLSAQDQDRAAQALAAELLSSTGGDLGIGCKEAVQRLACVTAFPYCAAAGGSVSSLSYLPPCQLQCSQVSRICQPGLYTESRLELNCGNLQMNHNCMLKIPSERFLLKPDQGPYDDIPAVYIGSLVLWAAVSLAWMCLAARHKEQQDSLSDALTSLPVLRVGLSVTFVYFWVDCAGAADMCRGGLAFAIFIYFPFVESVQMFLFLAAARGWGTTRQHLPLSTQRAHLAAAIAFYVCLIVLSSSLQAPGATWVMFSVLAYGTMYALILHAATAEMAVLDAQVRRLGAHVNYHVAWPLRRKHTMFSRFLLLVLGEVVLEAVCRYLLASRSTPFFTLVVVYEAGSAVLLLGICACFLPSKHSPFHYMVPTSLEYALDEEVGDEEGGEGGDAQSRVRSRVRRVLSARRHGREREEDVTAMEQLRLSRALRPSPTVEAFLRSALWWRTDSDTASGGDVFAQTEGLLTAAAAVVPESTVLDDAEAGLELQPFADAAIVPASAVRPTNLGDLPDSLDLSGLLRAAPSERGRQRRDWGLGGDHQPASSVPARAPLQASARVIALTSLAPSVADAEVVLAVQHSRVPR